MQRTRSRIKLVTAVTAATCALAAPASAAAAEWGAISVNPKTLRVGIAFNFPTKASAIDRSLRECGPNCQNVLWVKNKCGAIAVSQQAVKAGFGPTKAIAKAEAKAKAGGGRILGAVCA